MSFLAVKATVDFNLNVTGTLIDLGTGFDARDINAEDFLFLIALMFNSSGNTILDQFGYPSDG